MQRIDGPGPSTPAPLPTSSPERRGERSLSATLLVCVTCKSDQGPLGAGLFAALGERFAAEPDIALRPIECLSVCKRPCTVALAAPGKWTYVVGDLTREEHIEDIVTAARLYAASPGGIVPWRERPLSFRKGVVSRTPPLALP
jgi:predicted metal-binding protein